MLNTLYEDEQMEIQQYKSVPVTFGMEIEQPPTDIANRLINKFWYDCHDRTRGHGVHNPDSPYDWCKDGSGPRETNLPPSTHILSQLKKFINFVKLQSARWTWVNEYGGTSLHGSGLSGCGSHIHFRLKDNLVQPHLIADAWATAWNTILECSALMLPLLCHGSLARHGYYFRRSVPQWAQFNITRYSGPTLWHRYVNNPSFEGRDYHFISPNKRSYKPFTIELRGNESHPSIVYCFASYISRILREVFDKGMISPKLANRTNTMRGIMNAFKTSAEGNMDLYSALDRILDEVKFLPGRGIPRLKEHYDSYLECLDDILIKHHSTGSLVSSRTAFLFRQRGEPWRNSDALWDVLTAEKGDFSWNQPNIWAPDETKGRLPTEGKL